MCEKCDYKLKYKTGNKFTSYIPLHGHSTYSQGDGVTKIEDIMKRANEVGATGVSLTEHGNMSSFYKFYKHAVETGINPIIGCELYTNDLYHNNNDKFLEIKRDKLETIGDADDFDKSDASNNHTLVYAKNYKGVKNLFNISNESFNNFYRKPLSSMDKVYKGLNENNIITTGCLQSKWNQYILSGNETEALKLIKKFKDKFGDDFYLEIQLNNLDIQMQCNNFYHKVYEKTGIKPVFALDYHYANKDDWYIQYLLYVIRQRETVQSYTPDDWFYTVHSLYIKEIDEIYTEAEKYGLDKKFLELAIDSTFEINDKVKIELPKYPDNFPKYHEDKQQSESEFMQKLKVKWVEKIKNGLLPDNNKEYTDRLKYELDIIKQKGFIDYFLILDDLLNNFVYKVGGATGAGRGSAGGSLVLFVLDITKIDPIRHNLIFERFLNPTRIDPADVDLDIDSDTQKFCEDYLKDKFGTQRVCHIANFGKFGVKTTIKDLCRIHELDFVLSNKLTGYFSDDPNSPVDFEMKNAFNIAQKKGEKGLIQFIKDNKELFLKVAPKMIGMVRQTGRHASGILVSNKDLNCSEIPLLRLKGDIVTGVQEGGDEREVSELGYCKLDILGLKAASVINDTFKLVEKKYGKSGLEQRILKSDFDDKKVYDEFETGNCKDIFQFGSDNMINLIRTIKPKNIIDLSSINAMFRPAIIQAGGIDEYIKNRKNPEEAKNRLDKKSPILWDILGESFGVPIFQEQIMFILQKIGGFTLAEADAGRKILKLLHKGNQNKKDNFYKMLDQFKKGATTHGMKLRDIDELLDILGKYSEYSFNKSHSLAYAMNAYISMWQKVHFPQEYYASLLNHSTNEELSWFVKQIKKKGIKFNEFILGQTGNKFEIDYENNSIKFGLNLVKGVPDKDAEIINSIIQGDINTIVELAEFIIDNKVTKRTYEPLCRLGYFKEIFENCRVLEDIINSCRNKKKRETIDGIAQQILDDNIGEKDWQKSEKFGFEKKYFDFYFNEHPFIKYTEFFWENAPDIIQQLTSPKQIPDGLEKGRFQLYGIINKIIIKKSKKTGREFYKIVLEDDIKQLYITIFNTRDIAGLSSGELVLIPASKNKFGFTKSKDSKIKKLI
jgi:DNA polymerase-3 subunit alpha